MIPKKDLSVKVIRICESYGLYTFTQRQHYNVHIQVQLKYPVKGLWVDFSDMGSFIVGLLDRWCTSEGWVSAGTRVCWDHEFSRLIVDTA